MKTNWQHQKDAITTDQKRLTDDPRIHEEDKHRVKANEQEDDELIPRPAEKFSPGQKE